MGKKGLSTGHAVISGRDSQAMMINLTSRPELLRKGTMIGFVEEVTEIKEVKEEEATVIGHMAKGAYGAETGQPTADEKTTVDAKLDFGGQISAELSPEEHARVL